jgi:DNA mismatch endonuclease (patch repair protein)
VADHISPERRSWLMSRVKGKHTGPEVRVRRAAHKLGLRFRLHRRGLPGKPDLLFPKHRVVLFVHGCFWHRHEGCSKATVPKSNTRYWLDKFDLNIRRDSEVASQLTAVGWRVSIVWECETKSEEGLASRLQRIFGDQGGVGGEASEA